MLLQKTTIIETTVSYKRYSLFTYKQKESSKTGGVKRKWQNFFGGARGLFPLPLLQLL